MALPAHSTKIRPAWVLIGVLTSFIRCINAYTTNCPASCECIDQFRFYCPTYEQKKISFRVEENENTLTITCHTSDAEVYDFTPERDLGEFQTAVFEDCPAPFDRYTKRLGVQGVTDLRIKYPNGIGTLNVSANFLDDVPNITKLTFSPQIGRLPSSIFAKLTELTFLELGGSGLTHLSDGIFRNQKKLKILNLWGNKLQNLTKNAFDGVTSNVQLELSRNNIKALQSDVFHHMTNMTFINLSGNQLQSLPEGLLAASKKLERFVLFQNSVELNALPNGFLANLSALSEVRIRCGLKILPENTFNGSMNISELILNDNQLEELPQRLLATQRNLVTLDLSGNRLSQFPNELFKKTNKLRILRLSRNRFTNISDHMFTGLRQLEELYLDKNSLTHIDVYAFDSSQNLKVIDLQFNSLSFAHEKLFNFLKYFSLFERTSPFSPLIELRKLNLSHNNLSHFLHDWHSSNGNLEMLDLRHNHFNSINFQYISNIWHNITVNLSHNKISNVSLPGNISIVMGFTSKWILNDNPLHCDCRILNLVKFVHGDFDKISESSINYVTDNLKCAEPLRLKDKPVKSISPQHLLCPLKQSESVAGCSYWLRPNDRSAIINCSNANLDKFPEITQIENADAELVNIELWLENNKITELPSNNTVGYENVTHLYLRNNSVSSVVANNLPAGLTVIDLSYNQLYNSSHLPIEYFEKAPTLNISLGGNPWRLCDCALYLFTSRNTSHIRDHTNIVCGPDDRPILARGDLCSYPGPDWKIIISICVLTFVALSTGVIVAVALYKKYRKEIAMWFFDHRWCMWYWSQPSETDWIYDAFISFSHQDEDFVNDHLVPVLEAEPHRFRLCVHFRDWIIGEQIPVQIFRSVEESRKTIIVLSPHFLESCWSRLEFLTAIAAVRRIIVIILGDIGDIDNLDHDLRCYLRNNTYIERDDPRFFERLSRALRYPDDYTRNLLIAEPIDINES